MIPFEELCSALEHRAVAPAKPPLPDDDDAQTTQLEMVAPSLDSLDVGEDAIEMEEYTAAPPVAPEVAGSDDPIDLSEIPDEELS